MSSSETSSTPTRDTATAHPLDDILSFVELHRSARGADADAALLAITSRVMRTFAEYTAEHPEMTLDTDELSATAVATTCLRLLQAADLEVFELAMWQSWGGQVDITRLDPARSRSNGGDRT